jgi:hypothetical protein
MAECASLVTYFYVDVPDRPGEAARMLDHLKAEGVTLLVFSGFPRGRRAQLDFVPADATAFKAAARKARWKLTGPKRAFLVQGEDRVGVVSEVLGRLGAARINVVATQAVCAGEGRFGAILWVKPTDVRRAARVLGAA